LVILKIGLFSVVASADFLTENEIPLAVQRPADIRNEEQRMREIRRTD
jgi:hypothetical protein